MLTVLTSKAISNGWQEPGALLTLEQLTAAVVVALVLQTCPGPRSAMGLAGVRLYGCETLERPPTLQDHFYFVTSQKSVS